MSSINLDNLVRTGQLKSEPPDENEFQGLLKSGKARLTDANNKALAIESRFDLAYNAAHPLALAALRMKGYRPANRYIVFQTVSFTLGLGPEVWRILAKCHDKRNVTEYEGYLEIDDRLLEDLLKATNTLLDSTSKII